MSEGSARAGAREPELTAGDAAGDLRLKAKANVLNGGVKDQEKKGARRQAGGQKSDDRGQMHSSSRFQVPSPKFGAGNEEFIQLTVCRSPFTVYDFYDFYNFNDQKRNIYDRIPLPKRGQR